MTPEDHERLAKENVVYRVENPTDVRFAMVAPSDIKIPRLSGTESVRSPCSRVCDALAKFIDKDLEPMTVCTIYMCVTDLDGWSYNVSDVGNDEYEDICVGTYVCAAFFNRKSIVYPFEKLAAASVDVDFQHLGEVIDDHVINILCDNDIIQPDTLFISGTTFKLSATDDVNSAALKLAKNGTEKEFKFESKLIDFWSVGGLGLKLKTPRKSRGPLNSNTKGRSRTSPRKGFEGIKPDAESLVDNFIPVEDTESEESNDSSDEGSEESESDSSTLSESGDHRKRGARKQTKIQQKTPSSKAKVAPSCVGDAAKAPTESGGAAEPREERTVESMLAIRDRCMLDKLNLKPIGDNATEFIVNTKHNVSIGKLVCDKSHITFYHSKVSGHTCAACVVGISQPATGGKSSYLNAMLHLQHVRLVEDAESGYVTVEEIDDEEKELWGKMDVLLPNIQRKSRHLRAALRYVDDNTKVCVLCKGVVDDVGGGECRKCGTYWHSGCASSFRGKQSTSSAASSSNSGSSDRPCVLCERHSSP